MTVIFIISVALSEAINQFVSGTPNAQPDLPAIVQNPKINYLPLVLLIVAGVVWFGGHAIAWVNDKTQPTTMLNADGGRQSPNPPPLVQPQNNQRQTIPIVGLTLRSTWMIYDSAPGRWYPRKLNLQFSNDGEDEIHLGVGRWMKDQVGLQDGKPQRAAVHTCKTHLGKWDNESDERIVYPGQWVRAWVGLDSSMPDGAVNNLLTEGKLGTLEIPAEVSGEKIKIRVCPRSS